MADLGKLCSALISDGVGVLAAVYCPLQQEEKFPLVEWERIFLWELFSGGFLG